MAKRTGAVGEGERHDDEIAALDGANVGTDVLDDADRLVAHRAPLLGALKVCVGPEVAATDTRARDADDRVGRLNDGRVRNVDDPDVTGFVHEGCSHESMVPRSDITTNRACSRSIGKSYGSASAPDVPRRCARALVLACGRTSFAVAALRVQPDRPARDRDRRPALRARPGWTASHARRRGPYRARRPCRLAPRARRQPDRRPGRRAPRRSPRRLLPHLDGGAGPRGG